MLLDHVITKPPSLKGYDLHRLVQGLTDGDAPLFADMGDNLIIRTEKPITDKGTAPRTTANGDIVGFELRSCVSRKIRGRHVYVPTTDCRTRHAWPHTPGQRHGFEPLTISCNSTQAKIDDGKGRKFTVDQTDFVGVLRVTDNTNFQKSVVSGVGSTARTFGFGMLVI